LHEQLKRSQKEKLSKSGVRHKTSAEQSTDPIEPHIEGQVIYKKGAKEYGGYLGNILDACSICIGAHRAIQKT
jgi:hypothetical protein